MRSQNSALLDKLEREKAALEAKLKAEAAALEQKLAEDARKVGHFFGVNINKNFAVIIKSRTMSLS
jgi:hypothetical protein